MIGDVILIWFILQGAALAHASSNETGKPDMLTIRGRILFANGAPNSIPDGSTLTVKFQDTSRMDAPAIDLGTYIGKINGYKNGNVLTYEIETDKRPDYDTASLSAVLNIGWTPHGDEWIRQNDWLNDTRHEVTILPNVNEYDDKDVEVTHYT